MKFFSAICASALIMPGAGSSAPCVFNGTIIQISGPDPTLPSIPLTITKP